MAWINTIPSPRRGRPVFEVRWTEAGERRSERVGTDRALAEQVRWEKEEVERQTRAAKDDASLTGPALVDRFTSAMVTAGKRPGTLTYYGKHLKGWLAFVGARPARRWSRDLLEQHLAAHTAWSPRRRGMVVASVRRVVRWAKRAGLRVPQVHEGIELPREVKRARPSLDPADVDRLLGVVRGHRYEVPIALAAYAGLSLGDLYALQWGEVADGWITRPGGREKTGVDLRVPILPALAEVLTRRAPLRREGAVCGLLPKRRENTGETLRRIYARAGLAGHGGWHLLRHSCGKLLMRAGVHRAVIGRWLSHRPGSVVTDIYTTPDDADLLDAAARASALLSVGATPK